jgi:DNA-binding XRE family transcriptional regulator
MKKTKSKEHVNKNAFEKLKLKLGYEKDQYLHEQMLSYVSNYKSTYRLLRIKLRYFQEDWAIALGISRAYVSSFENGNRTPSVKVIYNMLDLAHKKGLNISFEDLRGE